MDIEDFCCASTPKIDEILQSQGLQTDLITKFAKRLKGRMAPHNRQQAIQLAQEYEEKLAAWLSPPWDARGEKATQILSAWGLPPPYRGLVRDRRVWQCDIREVRSCPAGSLKLYYST
jgi:hypothetical protein